MSDQIFDKWLQQFLEELVPLERSYSLAFWRANTSGNPGDVERLDRIERMYRGLFADAGRYRFLKAHLQEGNLQDPLLCRQLDLLSREFEFNQMSEFTLRQLVGLRVEVESLFNNFRATLGEKRVTDNQLREILRTSTSTGEVQAAWEASKQIGNEVAPKIHQLVQIRNSQAHSLGYESFQDMSLRLDEIDPEWLFKILDELAEITEKPYLALKEKLDDALSRRFGCPVEELGPWHYGDPFFQSSPQTGTVNLDAYYKESDLIALTVRFYEDLGLDIRDILEQSDLFEREGKCQHAFCADLDKQGDVRVLCNLKPNEYWMGTMLHEFGHAVYDLEFDPALPHLLRGPAHTLTTEAIAMLFGRASKDRRFLSEITGVDPDRAAQAAAQAREELRSDQLIVTRWSLVVVHFERELYRDPTQDLASTWWNLVERYQGIKRPGGRTQPDWATKIHIATSPVYYQNYILGELIASQFLHHLLENILGTDHQDGVGNLIGRREVGEFLKGKVFQPGRLYPWQELLERATGSRLELSHFVNEVTGELEKA